ncbi:hypothetical protein [Jannaschia rubra]|uniref:Cation/multidrug efflux pump n=1 Tax=Jannaschia rubra TaxID=282197 RepID=A0A0M6XTY2_9RHOB|nr:hypothetical protein [Jannaschia rubra]CTQ33655.1 hypothetical protein JAN5088_02439 [Jannaschia rubra]SFG05809.1 hypothetical protein SAMN04488517_102485 [Jannaschia rubra]
MALLKLTIPVLAGLTVIYWCLTMWFRAGERQRLEARWERDRPPLPQHTYVRNGIRDYDAGLRRRLVLGVYVVPIACLAVLIYAINAT